MTLHEVAMIDNSHIFMAAPIQGWSLCERQSCQPMAVHLEPVRSLIKYIQILHHDCMALSLSAPNSQR